MNTPQDKDHNAEQLAAKSAQEREDYHIDQQKSSAEAQQVAQLCSAIRGELSKVIIGQEGLIELLLAALLTNGHVLIEGVPGIAKTLTAKMLAKTLKAGFNRIQFTPDLMPTDIIGTTIFDLKRSEFYFKKGPIFSNIVLIDEINRAPAKTQAALMEVMEEGQVTVDGVRYEAPQPFFVVATQNPVEQEGTYRLPEAQLDRFMFKLQVNYPDLAEEKSILQRFEKDFYGKNESQVQAVVELADLMEKRALVEEVHISEELMTYIAQLVGHTRNNPDLYLGASPRASLSLLKAAKALAILDGRVYVIPDDVRKAAIPVLAHRILLSYEREIEGSTAQDMINAIVTKVDVPK